MSDRDRPGGRTVLEEVVNNVPAMVAYWDADLRCRFANRAYETWFGVTADKVIGMDMRELLGPLFALDRPYIEGALRGEEQQFEREIPDPAGGPPRYSQAHYVPDIVDGIVRGFCVLVADVTRRRQAEEALHDMERQVHANERLAAVATLAAGTAHEINNPLASVLANVELALEQIAASAADSDHVRLALIEARTGTKRIGEIEVEDNGCGIPQERLARILEPFFTTRPVGSGMGLGLSIAAAIVKTFGGTLAVASKVAEGSVFRISLPAISRSAHAGTTRSPELGTPQPAAPAPRARLLIIDDEVILTRTLARVLEEDYDVVALNHGREALALLAGDGGAAFALVLCDLMMPEVSGEDVYTAAVAQRPALAERFIIMTGGASTNRGRAFLDAVDAPVIDKPFDIAELRAVLRARLEAQHGS